MSGRSTRLAAHRSNMLNLIEAVRSNPQINRLEIGDFLFAEFTCGIAEEKTPLWAHQDYLIHVLTGKKTWHTTEEVFEVNPGDSVFFKKGAAIVEQHLEVDFCLLMFFIPDDFVRATVREIAGSLGSARARATSIQSAARVENDTALSAFFASMRTYFVGKEKPSEPLLLLKLKELVLSILTSGRNPALAAYFRSLADSDAPSIAEIMEANFRFNLSLEEYARLCHRSLSSFKRGFQASFQISPGKWLLAKRLDYAAALFRSSQRNVTEIAFDSGFEDVSHFSRAFKTRFGVSPVAYRQTPSAD
jgi:AraC family transcriptional regulator, exoenzyme S synthesis regulatory protein ExsA